MIVGDLHPAAASGTVLVDRLLTGNLLVVARSPDDRRKKAVHLVEDTVNPDDIDPLTTALRAIGARLTLRDAQIVAGFLQGVLVATARADETA